MKRFRQLVLLISILSAPLLQCSEVDENEKIPIPRFHTKTNEGIWINQSGWHLPVIKFSAPDKIDVSVPLLPSRNPIHYIEAIALMEGKREIETKRFDFTFDKARAHFTLPDPVHRSYNIVVKCNLHDMWMAPVEIPSKP